MSTIIDSRLTTHDSRLTTHDSRLTLAFVVPYFGRLPNYFPLWLKTCAHNPSVDFIVFTNDRTQYTYPDNVKVHYMEFSEFREIFQKHFDFPISLQRPYKLCDFKPTYGEILHEYLIGYDFWGHCDIDMIWGSIRKFITNDILDAYDRIYSVGHCTLYRNIPEVNSWYRTLNPGTYQKYREVFMSDKSFAFDEWAGHAGGGMSFIIQANNKRFYTTGDYAAISPEKKLYFSANREELKRKNLYFVWENGSLYGYAGETRLLEVLYLHWHNYRKIFIHNLPEIQKAERFLFVPPGIATCREIQSKPFMMILNRIIFAVYFAPSWTLSYVKSFVKRLIPKRIKKYIKRMIHRQ